METYLVRLARRRGRGEEGIKKGDNPSYRKKRGKLLMVYIIITGYLTCVGRDCNALPYLKSTMGTGSCGAAGAAQKGETKIDASKQVSVRD